MLNCFLLRLDVGGPATLPFGAGRQALSQSGPTAQQREDRPHQAHARVVAQVVSPAQWCYCGRTRTDGAGARKAYSVGSGYDMTSQG